MLAPWARGSRGARQWLPFYFLAPSCDGMLLLLVHEHKGGCSGHTSAWMFGSLQTRGWMLERDCHVLLALTNPKICSTPASPLECKPKNPAASAASTHGMAHLP